MGLLRGLFGPNQQDEAWNQLCREIGAEIVKGGFWKGDKLVARVGEWTITLDTFSVSHGDGSTTYTRLRAPYVNRDSFRFTVYRKSIFSRLRHLFGSRDVETGYREVDARFVAKGSDASQLKALFANPKIRQLLVAQPLIHLQVTDDEGWFGADFPDGVDELYCHSVGVITDFERLKSLFDLFSEVLHQLCHIGSAYEDDPGLAL